MIYPEEFKDKLLKFHHLDCFDEGDEVVKALALEGLKSGLENHSIGNILKEQAEIVFYASEIIDAHNNPKQLEKLYNRALRSFEAQKLYEEWQKYYNAYMSDARRLCLDSNSIKN